MHGCKSIEYHWSKHPRGLMVLYSVRLIESVQVLMRVPCYYSEIITAPFVPESCFFFP